MKISSNGLELIQHFEGFEGEVYVDAAGYPTIGYGHLIKAGEDFSSGISHAQAVKLLKQDVGFAENAVKRLIRIPLSQSQFDALVSFTFNLGGGALQRSTLRRKVNRHEHLEVPDELMRWVWAGGRRLRGLIRRRAAEAQLYIA
jgi:Phage-related lysozyme (muraminidase)